MNGEVASVPGMTAALFALAADALVLAEAYPSGTPNPGSLVGHAGISEMNPTFLRTCSGLDNQKTSSNES